MLMRQGWSKCLFFSVNEVVPFRNEPQDSADKNTVVGLQVDESELVEILGGEEGGETSSIRELGGESSETLAAGTGGKKGVGCNYFVQL